MAERQTLLARNLSSAPTVQPSQTEAVAGAFGDSSGLISLGQGIGNVGAAAANIIHNMQARDARLASLQEQSRKQAEETAKKEIASEAKRELEAHKAGVNRDIQIKLANNELPEDSFGYLDQSISQMVDSYKQRTQHLRSHPLYRSAVSEDELNTDVIRFKDSLVDNVASYVASRNVGRRVDTHKGTLSLLYQNPGDPAELPLRHDKFLASVIDDNGIPASKREALINESEQSLFAALFYKATEGKFAYTKEFIAGLKIPNERKTDLLVLSERLGPKTQSYNREDITGITNQVAEALVHGQPVSDELQATMPKAMDSIEAAFKDSDLSAKSRSEIQAKISLATVLGNIANFSQTGASFESLTQLVTALRTDESTLTFLKANINPEDINTNWDEIPRDDLRKFREIALKRSATTLEDLREGRLTKVLANSPRIQQTDSNLVASVRRAANASAAGDFQAAEAFTQEAILLNESYQGLLQMERVARLFPSDIRGNVPEVILTDLDNALQNEQSGLAVAQIYNIRAIFGREGTASYVSRAINSRSGGGTLRDKSHLAAFAAVQHYALFGKENDKTVNHTLMAASKEILDSVVNLPENKRQWSQIMPDHESMASLTFDSIHYQSNPDTEDVISGKAVTAASSKLQSPRAMASALSWAFQDRAMYSAFKELGKAYITKEALSGAQQAGDNVSNMINAGKRFNDLMLKAMTVVEVSSPNNPSKMFGVLPTAKMQQEQWYQFPVGPGGAGDAKQFGEDQSGSLKAVFVNMSKHMDRAGLGGNLMDWGTMMRDTYVRHTFTSWFSGLPLNESIYPLPASMDFDRELLRNTNISPSYDGSREGQSPLFHHDSLGAGNDSYTQTALTVQQNGVFWTNPTTGRYELYIRSGDQIGPGSDPVALSSYIPVINLDAGQHIGFHSDEVSDYHFRFRHYRITQPYNLLSFPIKSFLENVPKGTVKPVNLLK